MLNLSSKAVAKVVISKANVQVRHTDNNGKITSKNTIVADYVEYFFMDNTVEGFVLSKELPLLANPVAITKNHDLVGALSVSGNYKITGISVMTHTIRVNPYSSLYEYETIDLGQRSIQL